MPPCPLARPARPSTSTDSWSARSVDGVDPEIEHVGFWDLRFAVADRYRSGRVMIAGDAAHSHPPYGGYGINTGFEDARNLGWKLAAVVQEWAGPALLDSYDIERRPVFASTATDFIARSIEVDRDFLERFDPERDRVAFERAWSRRQQDAGDEVARSAPHYEGSSVVVGSGDGSPGAVGSHDFRARPGHHLPPATLGDRREVTALLGQGFSLLRLGPEVCDEEGPVTVRRGVPLNVVRARHPGQAERYGAPLVLVRPDGFVAWVGDSSSGLDSAVQPTPRSGDPIPVRDPEALAHVEQRHLPDHVGEVGHGHQRISHGDILSRRHATGRDRR